MAEIDWVLLQKKKVDFFIFFHHLGVMYELNECYFRNYFDPLYCLTIEAQIRKWKQGNWDNWDNL